MISAELNQLSASGTSECKRYPEYRDLGVEWLGEILEQVGDVRAKGLLERDVGNVLAFFKRKYGVVRDAGGGCEGD